MIEVNKSLMRPMMVAGVEKKLFFANILISFPLIAATHFHLPASLIGLGFFVLTHVFLRMVSQYDANLGKVFKRSTRYRRYIPPVSHLLSQSERKIKTVSRPW